MASHFQHRENVYPFPHKDYPERTRFIRNTHRPVDLYAAFEPETRPIREWPWIIAGGVCALLWIGAVVLFRALYS